MSSSLGPTIEEIRMAVHDAAEGAPIVRVFLFGSRARGDNRADSDIDLALETEPGFSLIDAGLFSDAVERGCSTPVDVISERFLSPSTKKSIDQDKVLVYER